MKITRLEMFFWTAAKEIKDKMSIFVGFHWPMIIVRIARRLHAPNTTNVYESGLLEDKSSKITPASPSDLISAENAIMFGNTLDALFVFLPRVDLAILDAPMVDRFGNVNTTCVGNYYSPKVRLPGSGGGTEVSSLAKKVLIVSNAEGKSRYLEKVDYVTSPGYLSGYKERDKLSYQENTGPYALINTLGKFLFDEETQELYLHSYYPMLTLKEIKENFSWSLKTSPQFKIIHPPNKEEIKIIREEIKKAKDRGYLIKNE